MSNPAPDLRERRRLATRAEISAAALTLFETQGFDRTTIDEVAHAAGVSARTCFRYFDNKEDLVLSMFEGFDLATAEWLENVDRDSALLDQLEAVYEGVLDGFVDIDGSVSDHLLRVRRLIMAEPGLRAAAMKVDADRAQSFAQRIRAAFGTHLPEVDIAIATEVAGAALRVTLDEWARLAESGHPAVMGEVYRSVRAKMRAATASRS